MTDPDVERLLRMAASDPTGPAQKLLDAINRPMTDVADTPAEVVESEADMAAFAASDAACYFYPGEHQHLERTAFGKGAVYAIAQSPRTQADETVRLREALEWYRDKAADCCRGTYMGDNARYALSKDGGKRASAALGDPNDRRS